MQSEIIKELKSHFIGELYYDDLMRKLYATDASVYRKLPLAVAIPKSKEDIKQLIYFAKENNTSLIPRTAGTSLAGQCVGEGIVVDVSKYFTKILDVNETNLGVNNVDKGLLDISWSNLEYKNENRSTDEPLFYIIFNKRNTELNSDYVLSLFNEGLSPTLYLGDGSENNLTLRRKTSIKPSIELYQNTPNPWKNETRIAFYLPEDEEITLRIINLTGKVVYSNKAVFNKGLNELQLESNTIGQSGVFYYSLEAENFMETRKMILLE